MLRQRDEAVAAWSPKDGDITVYEDRELELTSEIKISIEKVQQLTIEDDFGKNFDFSDHCVFAEARVIKRGT